MKATETNIKQAKQLKKLGIGIGSNDHLANTVARAVKFLWQPPLEYVCRWLRENFDIHVTPHPTYNAYGVIYMCTVFYIHKDRVHNDMLKDKPLTIDCTPPQIFDTYELAQSAGIDEALKIISKNKIKFITEKEKEKRIKKVQKQKAEHQKILDKSLENLKKFKEIKYEIKN